MNQESFETLRDEIALLRRERRAVLLVHNYQRSEIQDLADVRGDSLGLAQEAAKTNADVIVLCGVTFMAETAKLLNPAKKVLLPVKEAGCPMAEMIDEEDLRKFRGEHPEAVVVSYVNTTAATKAASDVCCTSANAVKVVESIPREREVIFTPDKNLGAYVQRVTGRRLLIWPGFCPTHAGITADMVLTAKREHPGAEVIVHPECSPEVIDLADAVKSTGGMLAYCATSPAREYIIGTEEGMLYPLRKKCPGKEFWPVARGVICPNMKLTTLVAVRNALRDMVTEVIVPADIAAPARRAIDRMLEIGRDGGS